MVEDKIRKIVEGPISDLGYVLDDIKYEKEGSTYFLRIIIDKNGYINIDDCVKVNGVVSPLLDKADPILESYILDICSKEKGSD